MNSLLSLIIVAVIALGAIVYWLGRRAAESLPLTYRSLALPRLPAAFSGWRILHLSDLHLEGRGEAARRLLDLARQAAPEVVAVTGDLLGGGGRRGRAAAAQLLRDLRARWPVYVVAGNSDWNRGRPDPEPEWRATGAVVLHNQALPIARGEETVWIAGVADPHRRRDDLGAALASVPPDRFVLLLAHSPDILLRPEAGRVDLILCGHTHGGQVALPGLGALWTHARAGRAWAQGVKRLGETVVVISRGAGTTRLSIRLGCPPEVSLLTLERPAEV